MCTTTPSSGIFIYHLECYNSLLTNLYDSN
jgi:hypothetical protein